MSKQNPRSKKASSSARQKPAVKMARAKGAVEVAGHRSSRVSEPEASFNYQSADDRSLLALIDMVRKGVSVNHFNKIAAHAPFSLADWAGFLQVSERTIQRNQKEKKAFQPVQSERIIELSMLYEYGIRVFGDQQNFDTWLGSRSIALGGRIPKKLLDTKFGIAMVRDELGRIEHGILA